LSSSENKCRQLNPVLFSNRGMNEVFRIAEGRDKSAPGALIAGIWGAIKAKLFGRSEEERRRRAWGA